MSQQGLSVKDGPTIIEVTPQNGLYRDLLNRVAPWVRIQKGLKRGQKFEDPPFIVIQMDVKASEAEGVTAKH